MLDFVETDIGQMIDRILSSDFLPYQVREFIQRKPIRENLERPVLYSSQYDLSGQLKGYINFIRDSFERHGKGIEPDIVENGVLHAFGQIKDDDPPKVYSFISLLLTKWFKEYIIPYSNEKKPTE